LILDKHAALARVGRRYHAVVNPLWGDGLSEKSRDSGRVYRCRHEKPLLHAICRKIYPTKPKSSMNALEFSYQFAQVLEAMFAFALKLTRDEEDAKDLVQEAAYRAYANREKFQPGTNFKAWINTIMRNIFISDYRQKAVRSMEKTPLEDSLFRLESRAADGDASRDLQYRDLLSLLRRLDEHYRIPFIMFYQGYRYDEIARSVRLPMGTVKSRIFYARQRLKGLIKEYYQ
jgi:RNA polymerase sigma factor (sigma-70 family)